MLISQEEIENIVKRVINTFTVNFLRWDIESTGFGDVIEQIVRRIVALEDYLDIHYEENTTNGYVKNKKVGKNKS